jgi:hypothetical protein
VTATWPKPATFFQDREIYIAIGQHRFAVSFETEEEWNAFLSEAENGICPFHPEIFGANVYKVIN